MSAFMHQRRDSGQWQNDEQNGQGTYTWASGSEYSGHWKDDRRNGQGTHTWVTGDKYVGQWKDDQRNGQGSYYHESGQIENYVFRKGEVIGVTAVAASEAWFPKDEKRIVPPVRM